MLTRQQRKKLLVESDCSLTLKQIRDQILLSKRSKVASEEEYSDSASFVSEPEAEMGDQLVKDLWLPQNVSVNVAQPVIQANNFELKPALISMVQHSQFSGSALNDPYEHINQFLEYCNTVKMNGVPADAIRLQLFPFSLRDGA